MKMKLEKEVKTNSEKRFRIRSKKLFLTYPKVLDIPNLEELFVKSLKDSIIGSGSGMNYLIVKENHEDGTPHIHVYLEFETTQYINSREQLQVTLLDPNTGEEVIQVGKYEPVKNRHKVIQYILKEIGFAGEISVKNTNMVLPIVSSIYYDSPESHLAAVLETEGFDAACATLLSCYKNLVVRKGSTLVTNLKVMDDLIQKTLNKSLLKIRSLDEFVVPSEIIE
jgi:hypothetical protein